MQKPLNMKCIFKKIDFVYNSYPNYHNRFLYKRKDEIHVKTVKVSFNNLTGCKRS